MLWKVSGSNPPKQKKVGNVGGENRSLSLVNVRLEDEWYLNMFTHKKYTSPILTPRWIIRQTFAAPAAEWRDHFSLLSLKELLHPHMEKTTVMTSPVSAVRKVAHWAVLTGEGRSCMTAGVFGLSIQAVWKIIKQTCSTLLRNRSLWTQLLRFSSPVAHQQIVHNSRVRGILTFVSVCLKSNSKHIFFSCKVVF